jgi:drug/metabolite transporter (DMT)-like permease
VLYNIAVAYTTAARASLALSTLPLQTMIVAALLGIEPLTARKSLGVAVAMLGVFTALASDALSGRIAILASFSGPQWTAGIYLGVCGGALAFILWVTALQRTTPTLVANTMTINPIAAGLLATQLVGEPITLNLIGGVIAVFAGIWIATTGSSQTKAAPSPAPQ